ncbi:MAG TPA: RHS repeat-associated core domain-containing protein [Candidatus Acidoferrales bacterium]|nr:RHS repeat-associated core domain-containing protein [Candidatus Acidoferrales bacterium]
MGITNKRDSTRTQSFTYDQLNRIVTAKTTATTGSNCWGETYTIDQWANLTAIGALSGYSGCTVENLSVSATTNNQLSATGFSYDTSGNMLNDGAHAYAYNAESEIKSAAGVNYTYDGDGNRIEKSSGKAYWYGAGTEILDESDLSGNITTEYVFFGGKRIAMRNVSSGTIYYYEDDMLGSARTMVQAGQTSVCYDGDFYPFGGERIVTNTCTQNYKFEGKERDTETGNDDFGARYYTSRLGRWLSADWSSVPAPVPYANLSNPQTLNLYAMVSDNPETFADLDGHGCSGIQSDHNPCPKQTSNTPPPPGEGQTGDGLKKSPTQRAQQTILQRILGVFTAKVGCCTGGIDAHYKSFHFKVSVKIGIMDHTYGFSHRDEGEKATDYGAGVALIRGKHALGLDYENRHVFMKDTKNVSEDSGEWVLGTKMKTWGAEGSSDRSATLQTGEIATSGVSVDINKVGALIRSFEDPGAPPAPAPPGPPQQ